MRSNPPNIHTSAKKPKITVIGDSTIDNKIWVGHGVYGNYISQRLGIKPDDTQTRIRKSQRSFNKTELSVVEHLMAMMPECDVRDYTNDGFTTHDVLYGEYRDKVFGEGTFSQFPHDYFRPLQKAQDDIKDSQHIILSIGGNNIREFLLEVKEYRTPDGKVHRRTPAQRKQYILNHFEEVFSELKKEYISIVNKIRESNPDATIILMTQYYPSFKQNTYKIYPFMRELGEVLGIGANSSDPMDVIHEIMKKTYTEALQAIDMQKVVVADVTSSLNPFDKKNHASQIEPSGTGGNQIARLLNHIIINNKQPGFAYKSTWSDQENDIYVTSKPLTNPNWEPAHPLDFKNVGCRKSLSRIYNKLKELDEKDPMHAACSKIYEHGKKLLINSHDRKDIAQLQISLKMAVKVLDKPDDMGAIMNLKMNSEMHAIGKPSPWKEFVGALSILVGLALCGLGIVATVHTGGLSLASLPLGGSLLSAGGAALFYSARKKSFAKDLNILADVAEETCRKPKY